MNSPELVRLEHEDRLRRLVAEAEQRRMRRESRHDTSDDRRVRRFSWFGRRSVDPKVARIVASRIAADVGAARALAATADLVDVAAGTVLGPGRHAYIALDDVSQHLVVADSTTSITLARDATLLVVTLADLHAISPMIPALAGAQHRSSSDLHTTSDHPMQPAPEGRREPERRSGVTRHVEAVEFVPIDRRPALDPAPSS